MQRAVGCTPAGLTQNACRHPDEARPVDRNPYSVRNPVLLARDPQWSPKSFSALPSTLPEHLSRR
jgi:hypothetical protein